MKTFQSFDNLFRFLHEKRRRWINGSQVEPDAALSLSRRQVRLQPILDVLALLLAVTLGAGSSALVFLFFASPVLFRFYLLDLLAYRLKVLRELLGGKIALADWKMKDPPGFGPIRHGAGLFFEGLEESSPVVEHGVGFDVWHESPRTEQPGQLSLDDRECFFGGQRALVLIDRSLAVLDSVDELFATRLVALALGLFDGRRVGRKNEARDRFAGSVGQHHGSPQGLARSSRIDIQVDCYFDGFILIPVFAHILLNDSNCVLQCRSIRSAFRRFIRATIDVIRLRDCVVSHSISEGR